METTPHFAANHIKVTKTATNIIIKLFIANTFASLLCDDNIILIFLLIKVILH